MEHHGRSLLSFALSSVRRCHAPPDMCALLALAVQYHVLWSQYVESLVFSLSSEGSHVSDWLVVQHLTSICGNSCRQSGERHQG